MDYERDSWETTARGAVDISHDVAFVFLPNEGEPLVQFVHCQLTVWQRRPSGQAIAVRRGPLHT